MKLYIVRHGQTNDNVSGRVQGWRNNPINRLGKKQVAITAQELKDVKFDLMFCSPSKRTRMTAKILNKTLKIRYKLFDRRIMEKSGGNLEGKLRSKMKPETLKAFRETPKMFDAETFTDVHARVSDFLEYLKRTFTNETILVVMHGGPIQVMDFIMQGKTWGVDEYQPIKVENASVRVYELKGYFEE